MNETNFINAIRIGFSMLKGTYPKRSKCAQVVPKGGKKTFATTTDKYHFSHPSTKYLKNYFIVACIPTFKKRQYAFWKPILF